MSGMLDLFGDADIAPAPRRQPATAKRQPATPACPPEEPICKPAPPQATAAPSSWAYIHPPTTPAGVIAFACICGAREDRAPPSLDNVVCWRCREPDGMRPRPWCPTAADLARGVRR